MPKGNIKVGDNITTDHVMPSGTKLLPLGPNYHIFLLLFQVDPSLQKVPKKQGRFVSWRKVRGLSQEHTMTVISGIAVL